MLHNVLCDGVSTSIMILYHNDSSLIYILSYQNLHNLLLIFIQNNGNVNAVDKQHGSPLQLAARMGHTTIAHHLVGAGADIELPRSEHEPTVLFTALYGKHQDVAQLLLRNGACHNIVNDRAETPLIVAASKGCMAVVQKLLQLGVNVNIEGGKALQAAANGQNWQIVELLVQSGANVNFNDKSGGNALQAAAVYDNYQIVKLLLESGADANSGNGGNHSNALQAAFAGENRQIVELLLLSGANVNSEKIKRGTALQAAARRGNEQAVRLLLHAGADLNIGGSGLGGDALQMAASNGHVQVVQLLLNAGADVNSIGGDSGTALQMAEIGRAHV